MLITFRQFIDNLYKKDFLNKNDSDINIAVKKDDINTKKQTLAILKAKNININKVKKVISIDENGF